MKPMGLILSATLQNFNNFSKLAKRNFNDYLSSIDLIFLNINFLKLIL